MVKIDCEKLIEGEDWSFKALRERVDYVKHLTANSIYMELPVERSKLILLAQVINLIIKDWDCPRIHFEVPLKFSDEDEKVGDFKDSWNRWNFFRTLIRNPAVRVCVALRIEDLPEEDEQDRWMGEKVKMAILPPESFVNNIKGFPVLTRAHQKFIQNLFDSNNLSVSVAMKANPDHTELRLYIQYLNQLLNGKFLPEKDPNIDHVRDVLQVPLQPLKDNLQSHTYEIFEKDPVKYEEYRKAILAAFQDRPGKDKL